MPHPDEVDSSGNHGKEIFSSTYFPGYVTEDSTAHAMDNDTTVSVEALFNSDHLGGDYFAANERIRINDWTPLDTLGSQMQVSRIMTGTPGSRVYAGRRSVRAETRWWHDLVTDTTTSFALGPAPSNAELFLKTRPVAWFGKGFRTLVNGDTARLGLWVERPADAIAVYRWERTSATDTTLQRVAEPLAEQLYDITLLDTSATGVSDDNVILAITNRRSSPFLFNTSLPDSIEWVSTYEHDTLTRGSRPDLRYQQVGARRLMLPLRYAVEQDHPYLLRVRALHPQSDTVLAMDTIVRPRTTLAIDLRPGETRYLHVQRLRAHDTVDRGYLAYSTQSKLIAYPVAKADGTGYTDAIRYHMVYHRKDTDTLRGAFWTVFYQRSVPYPRDSVPDVAGMQWETPARLSRMTMLSTPSTDGLSRTRYVGVDSADYEGFVDDTTSAMQDCCCGFPSIVVRERAPNVPKVFVVYACEDMWAGAARDNYFHIVENAFDDVPVLNTMALQTNGKSLVVAPKDLPHDGGTDTLKSLARYGTPVINASADSIMYYAWSAAGTGIGVGTKPAMAPFFLSPQAVAEVPMPDIMTSTGDTILGGTARFPSLNVYSNIGHGRTDATLVWQEGADYPHIRYTRLIPGVNWTIDRMLPDFVEMSYYPYSPPGIATDAAAAIAVVGGSRAELAVLPTVVRSLQTDTLSMFIRDSDVGLDSLVRYAHETVAWEEYVVAEQRGKVRYNHFIDRTGYGTDELHYWQANGTGGIGLSVFHPVVTNGAVRIDSLVWQGQVDTTLLTYHDSLRVLRGNLSDSSLIVNYSILPNADYLTLRDHRQQDNSTYWTGQAEFANLRTQQIMIRRLPLVPGVYGITYHDDTLEVGGAWPHLAMRQREDWPAGIQAVRRVLQHSNADAPHLVASAEQFYKPTAEDAGYARRVQYGGIERGDSRFVARVELSDGTSLPLLPVHVPRLPDGYTGNSALAQMMTAQASPPREYLTDAFSADGIDALKLVSTGAMRDNLEVMLEEVDITRMASVVGLLRGSDDRAFILVPAAADDQRPERPVRSMYYLTNPQDVYYRVRLRYLADDATIYRSETEIDAQMESFARSADQYVQVVDLGAMHALRASVNDALVYPNPSSGAIRIVLPAGRTQASVVSICDAMGRIVERIDASPTQVAVDVPRLESGSYTVRIETTAPTHAMPIVQRAAVVR